MEILNVKEVAQKLRCSPCHVRDLCCCGKLEGFKDAGRWKIPDEKLDKYISQAIETSRLPETETQKFVRVRRGLGGRPRIVTHIE